MPRRGGTPLLTSLHLGSHRLPNRIVMAPMTRGRADANGVPSPLAPEYYARRAEAGLIITEATHVSPEGLGYPGTPGIYTDAQAAAWRDVTHAVHARGGRIFLQLWHVGRVSHPCMQPGGGLPLAPSAIAPDGQLFTLHGRQPFVVPRALAVGEIGEIVEQFGRAARYGREAGFDGIDIHAANGYLIDQFLRDGSNRRTDRFGGTIANRLRFLLEILDAVTPYWGPERVGVRISPLQTYNGMEDSDPFALFVEVASNLSRRGVGYLHVVEPGEGHPRATPRGQDLLRRLRLAFERRMIVDGGCDGASATAAMLGARADLVALATPFIANPDLVSRIRLGLPLAVPDPRVYYEGGERGYVEGSVPSIQSLTAEG